MKIVLDLRLAVIFRNMVRLWKRLRKKARDRTGFGKYLGKGRKTRLDLKQQQIDVSTVCLLQDQQTRKDIRPDTAPVLQ